MLSQRLGLYYFANEKRLQTEKTKAVLKATFNKLDDAISELLISDFNNDRIEETLTEAMGLWEEVKTEKEKLFDQKLDKANIYNKTNRLTKIFNKLTLLYEKVK